jgi:broad specificity phosphatase PhoE
VPDVRLLLVRHGESTWNADGRWQGQADPPLTDRGREQARAAAAALPDRIDGLWASDLERARVTAELLGAEAGAAPIIDAAFRERDAGAFSGLTRTEIHAAHPGLLPDDPARRPGTEGDGLIAPPGWEPDTDLAARAWAGIERVADALAATGGTTAVVVTHSGLIYAVERPLTGDRERIANLEGRWLHRVGGRWEIGPRHLLLDPETTTVTRPDQL